MKIGIIIVKLLFLGALFIISNNNLHLKDVGEREVFFKYYSSWLENIFNQGQSVTSYVVRFEWLPKSNESYVGDNSLNELNYNASKKRL